MKWEERLPRLDRISNKYLHKIEVTALYSLLLPFVFIRHSCDLHSNVPPKMPRPNAQSLGMCYLLSRGDFEDAAEGLGMERVCWDT